MTLKLSRVAVLLALCMQLSGCLAAVASIAIQAAMQTTLETTANVITAAAREDAIREYASLGFTVGRPDAVRPPSEAVDWLKANREPFREELSAYNEEHELVDGADDFGGNSYEVKRIDWIILKDARLDYLSAMIEFHVGERDLSEAVRTFVLRWEGDGLAVVDHLDSDDSTLAAYLGLPPSPPEPVDVAREGGTSEGAITPASLDKASAAEIAEANGFFQAWLAENEASLERALSEVARQKDLLASCASQSGDAVPLDISSASVEDQRPAGMVIKIAYAPTPSTGCAEAREDEFLVKIEQDALVHFEYLPPPVEVQDTVEVASAADPATAVPQEAEEPQEPQGPPSWAGEWYGEAEFASGRVSLTIVDGAVTVYAVVDGRARDTEGQLGSDGSFSTTITMHAAWGSAVIEVDGTFPDFKVSYFTGVNHEPDREITVAAN